MSRNARPEGKMLKGGKNRVGLALKHPANQGTYSTAFLINTFGGLPVSPFAKPLAKASSVSQKGGNLSRQRIAADTSTF